MGVKLKYKSEVQTHQKYLLRYVFPSIRRPVRGGINIFRKISMPFLPEYSGLRKEAFEGKRMESLQVVVSPCRL